MKDSKRIDNKAKSRRIAAYALAGCMAVTAAPMTMPNMGIETVEAATLTSLANDASYTLTLDDARLKSTTTYAEVASKLYLLAADDSANYAIWAKGAAKVSIKDNVTGELIWDSEGHTSTPGTTKIGNSKTYNIEAEFKRTLKVATDSTATVDGSLATTVDTKTVTITGKVFYPTEGMLSNELLNGSHEAASTGSYKFMKPNGIDTTKKGVLKNSSGWYLVYDGVAKPAVDGGGQPVATIEKNVNGSWYIDEEGKVDFTKTGVFEAIEGSTPGKTVTGLNTGMYYVENGKVNYNKTGLVLQNGIYYNVVKGVVKATGDPTVVKAPNGKWIYMAGGESDPTFTGVAKNDNGTWYIKYGVVDFTKEGPVYVNSTTNVEVGSPAPTVKGLFMIGGKLQQNTTGTVFYNRTAYYLTKGVIESANFDEETLAKDVKTGKWYLLDTDGSIKFGTTGLYQNQYGIWYVDNGKVDFEMTGVVTDDFDEDGESESYYLEGGKVQTGRNGLVMARSYGRGSEQAYNLKSGRVQGSDINKSVLKAPNGKWFVMDEDGIPASNAIAGNSNGVWISKFNGEVDFEAEGFHKVSDTESKLSNLNEDDIVYIKGGKVQTGLTGFVDVRTLDITISGSSALVNPAVTPIVYIKNGVVSSDAYVDEPTVIKGIDGTWYYADETGFNQGYTGVAANKNGTWYVEGGIVKFNATGFYTDEDGKTYYFIDSKLSKETTGAVKAYDLTTSTLTVNYIEKGMATERKTSDNVVKATDGVWYYIDDKGNINNGFTGFAQNKNGVWYIKDGKVDFTKNGHEAMPAAANNKADKLENLSTPNLYIVNGKVQLDFTGFVVDGTYNHYFEKGEEAENNLSEIMKGTDGNYYYVEDGVVTTGGAGYTGLAKSGKEFWYVYQGKVTFGKTDVIDTPDVDGTDIAAGKYYIVNGKMTSDKNGVVKSGSKQYYIQKSAVVTGIKADERVIKVDGTWYYINENGEVDTPNDKLGANSNGVWYIKDGKVDFTKTDLVAVDDSTEITLLKNAGGKRVYISGGKFQEDTSCVYASRTVDPVYIKKGVESTDNDFSVTTAVKGTDGKTYAVTKTANAIGTNCLAKSEDGIVYANANGIIDSKVSKVHNVTADDADLITARANDKVVVIGGKFAKDTTGVVSVKDLAGTSTVKVYVEKGVCTETVGDETLVLDKASDTLYYVGTTSYTVDETPGELLGKYGVQLYYVRDGKVRKISNKKFVSGNKVYDITEGKADLSRVVGTAYRAIKCQDNAIYLVDRNGDVLTSVNGVVDTTTGKYNFAAGKAEGVSDYSADTLLTTQAVFKNGSTSAPGGDDSGSEYLVDKDGKVVNVTTVVLSDSSSNEYTYVVNGKVTSHTGDVTVGNKKFTFSGSAITTVVVTI